MRWQQEVESHKDQVIRSFPNYIHFATMLYGSQNYNLATELSDVDTKSIVIPPIKDIILGKHPLSKKLTMTDGSFDDTKDPRMMFNSYLKGNINFIETLYTSFVAVNPFYISYWKELQQYRDLVCNAQPRKIIHMAQGMAQQKYVAMTKPFESKKNILQKYGYDLKQLYHLVRLKYFIKMSLKYPYDVGRCIKPPREKLEFLISLKKYPISLSEAIDLATNTMDEIKDLVVIADKNLLDKFHYEEAIEWIDDFIYKLLIYGRML